MHSTGPSKDKQREFEALLAEIPVQIRNSVRDSLSGGHEKREKRQRQMQLEYEKAQKNKRRGKRDPELNSDQITEWYNELKSALICTVCSESTPECLVFHHIDPTTKIASISSMIRSVASKQDIITEINKCVVLCHNCHVKAHIRIKQASMDRSK